MTDTSTTTAFDWSQLSSMVEQLRQQNPSHENLWHTLLQGLHCSEAELQRELEDQLGVLSWSHSELQAAMPNGASIDPSQEVHRIYFNGSMHIVAEDPWCPAAAQMMAKSMALGGKLVILKHSTVNAVRPTTPDTVQPGKPQAQAGAQEAPPNSVVDWVDHAIRQGYHDGVSDIHFEMRRDGLTLRYRLDGVMAAADELPPHLKAEELVSRIKVMAQLDITERRRPQDGRIHWRDKNGISVDLRVSVMPSIFGEDVVLRLLDKSQLRQTQDRVSLDSLGLDGESVLRIRGLARRPHGMLLVTGPTGSGKTTTVYAALSEINHGLEKIVTIEDPVEYELEGVLQIPVNEQKGLTFATGLRSILRHDPDTILVGEIRDAETAEIAVQSALTGHLVFTTVHANSFFDVIGRFHHFHIEPFALASALNGILVQRLLRKLCPHCVQWRSPSVSELKLLQAGGAGAPLQVPAPGGCPDCRGTGYKGRFVVSEVIQMNQALRDLLVHRVSMSELSQAMYSEGSQPLIAQAIARVLDGTTSLEEVARVVGFS